MAAVISRAETGARASPGFRNPYTVGVRWNRLIPRPLRSVAALVDGDVGRVLRRTVTLEFSEEEWAAIERAQRDIEFLQSREESIRVEHRGPATERMERGMNEIAVGEWAKRCGVPPAYRLLLFALIREFKPRRCVEFGMAAGYSALYAGHALRLNGSGVLHTVEGDAESFEVGARMLEPLASHVRPHRRDFEDFLGELPRFAPLDLVLVDGAHGGDEEVRYAARMAEHLSLGALVIWDDIKWGPGMKRAWEVICRRPEVALSVDLGKQGLIQTGAGPARHYEPAEPDGNYGAARE